MLEMLILTLDSTFLQLWTLSGFQRKLPLEGHRERARGLNSKVFAPPPPPRPPPLHHHQLPGHHPPHLPTDVPNQRTPDLPTKFLPGGASQDRVGQIPKCPPASPHLASHRFCKSGQTTFGNASTCDNASSHNGVAFVPLRFTYFLALLV